MCCGSVQLLAVVETSFTVKLEELVGDTYVELLSSVEKCTR